MSDLLHEQLSALIDGELPVAETTLLLKRLEREPELRARLARYRVCGTTLRGTPTLARTDFCLKVSTLVASEPAHAGRVGATAITVRRGPASAPRAPLPRYLRPLAGLGVAAAVAATAILVVGRTGPAGVTAVAPVAQVAVVAPRNPALDGATLSAAIPAVARRLQEPAYPLPTAIGAEPASYVTPAPKPGLGEIPRAELANYVVIHAGVSGPMGLHSALTSLVTDDAGAAAK